MELRKIAITEFAVLIILVALLLAVQPAEEPKIGVPTIPTPPTPTQPEQTVCGNGVVEKGESWLTCCADAGCPTGLECVGNSCRMPPTTIQMDGPAFWLNEGETVLLSNGVEVTVGNVTSKAGISLESPEVGKSSALLSKGQTLQHGDTSIKVIYLYKNRVRLQAQTVY